MQISGFDIKIVMITFSIIQANRKRLTVILAMPLLALVCHHLDGFLPALRDGFQLKSSMPQQLSYENGVTWFVYSRIGALPSDR